MGVWQRVSDIRLRVRLDLLSQVALAGLHQFDEDSLRRIGQF
jgi:hypothetical protein